MFRNFFGDAPGMGGRPPFRGMGGFGPVFDDGVGPGDSFGRPGGSRSGLVEVPLKVRLRYRGESCCPGRSQDSAGHSDVPVALYRI